MSDKTRRFMPGLLMVLTLVTGLAHAPAALAQTMTIDGETFRDPTRPATAAASATSVVAEVVAVGAATVAIDRANFELSFIRTGGSRPIAVINNKQLTIGDEIDGVTVVDIRSGEVVLSAQGQQYVLTTFSRPVREPVQ